MQKTSYMICTTPRSGSTLLCDALRLTGVAGNPDEYFGPMHVPRWREQWGITHPVEYLPKVLEHGSTPNGVFGVKIMKLYWANFLETLKQADGQDEPSEYQLISAALPNLRYIWITRRNKIRQGVSWARVMEGMPWVWHEAEPYVPQKKPQFQFDLVDQFIAETVIHEAAWQEFFTKNEIKPYVVVYEDFLRSFEESMYSIFNFLGLKSPQNGRFNRPKLKQQADTLSDEWADLYQKQKEAEWAEKGWNRIGY